MATSASFAELAHKIDLLRDELSGANLEAVLGSVGRELVPLVSEAVARTPGGKGSLSDGSMSHWRRGKPIPITGTASVRFGTQLEVAPSIAARGPMRVLEDGRKGYRAGDRRASGYYVRKRDGVRMTRTKVVKGFTGEAGGKGTWTAATAAIRDKAPGELNKAKVAAMARIFR